MDGAGEPARLKRARDDVAERSKRRQLNSEGRASQFKLPMDVWELVAQRLGLRGRMELALTCKDMHRKLSPLLDFHHIAPKQTVRFLMRLFADEDDDYFGDPQISGDGNVAVVSRSDLYRIRGWMPFVWNEVPSGRQRTVSLPGLTYFRVVHVSHNGSFAVLIIADQLYDQRGMVLVHRPPAQTHVRLPSRPPGQLHRRWPTHVTSSVSERFIAMCFENPDVVGEGSLDMRFENPEVAAVRDCGDVLVVDSEGTVIRELALTQDGVRHVSCAEWGAEDRLVVATSCLRLWIYEAPHFSAATRRFIHLRAQVPCLPSRRRFSPAAKDVSVSFREGRVFVRFKEHGSVSEPLDYVHETLRWSRCLCEHREHMPHHLCGWGVICAGCRQDTLAPWFLERDVMGLVRVLHTPPHPPKLDFWSSSERSMFNGPWTAKTFSSLVRKRPQFYVTGTFFEVYHIAPYIERGRLPLERVRSP